MTETEIKQLIDLLGKYHGVLNKTRNITQWRKEGVHRDAIATLLSSRLLGFTERA